jgi:RNA polymerase sigma factor (sigma-70 family)
MASKQHQDDAALLKRIMDGNKELYRKLVDKYRSKVYSYAYSICSNEADASDVTQETFIRFYKNITQFDIRRPLQPYLLKITVNCSRNLLKKRKTLAERFDSDSVIELESISSHEQTPLNNMVRIEKILKVREKVSELPVNLREVCSLFYLSDHSCAEVAAILKISEGSVKVSLHRARKKLLNTFKTEWSTG